ncbi:hypothetical protein [Lutimonas zeaxanthinifaciens]|uniref:hypothetical protein n=1 Tax=Lutimonas zeaxanthinifaciens TaxID=3060215 RepID=UPI00265C96ED|nr:hypothetical protein [Lutimonas sp. YSD2104]WKK65999.1 hypothetical protein QZH61_15600 [Lutimonas sp. YSD2104]
MKKLLKPLVLALLMVVLSCSDKDCEDIDCFTPPFIFTFDIQDKESGENLFENGTYTEDQIEVVNKSDGSERAYQFIGGEINFLRIPSIGWETEIAEVVIKLDGQEAFTLFVDVERLTENCCNFSKYNETRIDNADYEYDQQREIYRIYLEQ